MKVNSDRYINLLGDPIHWNPVVKAASPEELSLSCTLGAFFEMASRNEMSYPEFLESMEKAGLHGLQATILFKHLLERTILKSFSNSSDFYLTNKRLSEICIDTNPSIENSMASVTKYGSQIKTARFLYGGILGVGIFNAFIGASLKAYISSDIGVGVSDLNQGFGLGIAGVSRLSRGYRRFLKLADGEWAIILTPDQQEKVTKDIKLNPFNNSPEIAKR